MDARTSTTLYTDHYELTMLDAALTSGVAHQRSVFEVFARRLPEGRRYGVVGGIGRLVEALESFSFTPQQIDFLAATTPLSSQVLDYLKDYHFTGTIRGYQEGDFYFPFSPVLTVEATFGEAVLLETLILSILNHDSAIASAASRMVSAAKGRPIIEMGSRRTHEESAVSASRIACLLGFTATSNLEAGFRYGVPTRGTSAHAFTLAHMAQATSTNEAELKAFAAQVQALGVSTTLLVDTFDTTQGIRNAVQVAGVNLGAIRIDSGDLTEETKAARTLLDSLGAFKTKIVVSSDLDEYAMEELLEAGAPVDSFGVGTRLVTGSGAPTASFVYKLVAIENTEGVLTSVAKKSSSKISLGGEKYAYRTLDSEGFLQEELIRLTPEAPHNARSLQTTLVQKGESLPLPTLEETRSFHAARLAELRSVDRSTLAGTTILTATL